MPDSKMDAAAYLRAASCRHRFSSGISARSVGTTFLVMIRRGRLLLLLRAMQCDEEVHLRRPRRASRVPREADDARAQGNAQTFGGIRAIHPLLGDAQRARGLRHPHEGIIGDGGSTLRRAATAAVTAGGVLNTIFW